MPLFSYIVYIKSFFSTDCIKYKIVRYKIGYIIGYKIVRLDRNKHGGGLAIFISEDLKFEIRHDVPLHNLELIILKILPYRGVPFNLMTWYRTTKCKYRQL